MSTTFSVYPKIPKVPTFEEVTNLATSKLRAFLKEFDIAGEPLITVELRQKEPDVQLPIDSHAPATWPDETYAWFKVPPIAGGADAYFWPTDKKDRREYWDEVLERNEKLRNRKDRRKLIEACLGTGYRWHLRRSAGQAAIIHLAYGLVAGSFAELTEGFIDTGDGGWDYQRFPATAAEFNTCYFRPALALNVGNKEWAETCIRRIPKDLSLGTAAPDYSDEYL
jgi:hypothetical protein